MSKHRVALIGGTEGSHMENFQWKGIHLYHNGEATFHSVPQQNMFVEKSTPLWSLSTVSGLHQCMVLIKGNKCSASVTP